MENKDGNNDGNPDVVCGSMRQGAKQFQEDSFLVFSNAAKTLVVGGIFDGHGGKNGSIASQAATERARKFFIEVQDVCLSWNDEEWEKKLSKLFEDMHCAIRNTFVNHEDILRAGSRGFKGDASQLPKINVDCDGILRRQNGYPIHGGTTGTICVLITRENKSKLLITANVGDSDAILINSKFTSERLSVDHGPDRKAEFLRIQGLSKNKYPEKLLFVYDKDNVYRKYECPLVFLPDGTKDPEYVRNPWGNGLRPTNVRYDPAVYAVTPKGITTDVTCIAMTRSLGDFYAHKFGLTFEPSIGFRKFEADEKFFVILASDGIWDCWHFDSLATYIGELNNEFKGQLSGVVNKALDESIKKAKASFGASHYDDASVVLIRPPQ